MGLGKVGNTQETCFPHVRKSELRLENVALLQVGLSKVGPGEISLRQIGLGDP